MDHEYDRKFEEMKMYIPFLESMIKRLESTSKNSLNPRQAQLDKIRSLRDLLLDKKKRMKMDNLLKCEQVLLNLYAKVEQRDTLPESPKDESDLNTARNKLKSVAENIKVEPDTLPEIARASEIQAVCSPGSKEPALFQRRPHMSPPKTVINARDVCQKTSQSAKRNYTRVLISPESSPKSWSPVSDNVSNPPLFSRRSPRRSPRKYSPSYRRDRKKSKEKHQLRGAQDLNITIKVPEESLNSLDTEDIFSRIINCKNNDVDIDTLRELRTQILGELKQTGANNDISDLILKSYKNKCKKGWKKKEDVEEGEISDSESEAIDNIYGSLVILDKDKNKIRNQLTPSKNDDQSRKIQICLVINSDKDKTSKLHKTINDLDLEMFEQREKIVDTSDCQPNKSEVKLDEVIPDSNKTVDSQSKPSSAGVNPSQQVIISDDEEHPMKLCNKKYSTADLIKVMSTENTEAVCDPIDQDIDPNKNIVDVETKKQCSSVTTEQISSNNLSYTPNFYTPLTNSQISAFESSEATTAKEINIDKNIPNQIMETVSSVIDTKKLVEEKPETSTQEIPLLHDSADPPPPKEDVVSEIDILEALKNEILNEITPIPGIEAATPVLHQPKVTKVASKNEIVMPKKRISIEKYKEKSVTASKPSLYLTNSKSSTSDDILRKQSIKLTEKEFERFNLSGKFPYDDSSDENDNGVDLIDDVNRDIAPKSPDSDSLNSVGNIPPIIIPADPVKLVTVNSKKDVDMRTLPGSNTSSMPLETSEEFKTTPRGRIPPSFDPRIRRDMNVAASPAYYPPPDRTPIHSVSVIGPNMTPSRVSNARTYEMTPTHQTFEIDESQSRKHVYTPILPSHEIRDFGDKSNKELQLGVSENIRETRSSRFDIDRDSKEIYPRSSSVQRDELPDNLRLLDTGKYGNSVRCNVSERRDRFTRADVIPVQNTYYGRTDCPPTPTPSFGRYDLPTTPVHPFGRSDVPITPNPAFGNPGTPIHPFGRSECHSTFNHSYDRADGPVSHSHLFGRSECPTTPTPSFGRHEVPTTPIHPFGRSECPMTPVHPYGRSDVPRTPTHPFGRSEYSQKHTNTANRYQKDPRLNRSYDYQSTKSSSEANRDQESYDRHYGRRPNYAEKSNSSFKTSESYARNSDKKDQNYSDCGAQAFKQRDGIAERSVNIDNDDDKLYGRGGNSRLESRYQRDHSVGRSSQRQEIGQTHCNVNVNKDLKNTVNTLSVKSDAGRSFTIDTSVNRTFQQFIDKKGLIDTSTDNKRERAKSVGRALVRESSVGRSLYRESSVGRNLHEMSVDINETNRSNYLGRARSVGRDPVPSQKEKSVDELKAQFECYKSESIRIQKSTSRNGDSDHKSEAYVSKYVDPRSKKERNDRESNSQNFRNVRYNANSYSPRNNKRDPRMRRNQSDSNSRSNDYRNGIVYSNDNIARGTILGAGTGVKNYRIPKIKRPNEEEKESDKNCSIESENIKGKSADDQKNNSLKKSEAKEVEEMENIPFKISTDKTHVKGGVTVITDTDKRVTRSQKSLEESESVNNEVVTRRKKKLVIYDSEDNEDQEAEQQKQCRRNSIKCMDDKEIEVSNNNKEIIEEKINDVLDSSFSLEDLDLFPENIATDSVMDNINALIADLDNDIEAKSSNINSHLMDDLPVQKMPNNTTISINDNQSNERCILNAIDDFIREDKKIISPENNEEINPDSDNSEAKAKVMEASRSSDNQKLDNTEGTNTCLKNNDENDSSKVGLCEKSHSNENDNLSKTGGHLTINDQKEQKESVQDNFKGNNNSDNNAAPDSTIDLEQTVGTTVSQDLISSANDDKYKEMDGDITSTHEMNSEPTVSHISQKNMASNSLESLISILQDKSKIKELLGMLGDKACENEKIRKKLKKLSEIVSDDEDGIVDVKEVSQESAAMELIFHNEGDKSSNLLNKESGETSNHTSSSDGTILLTEIKLKADLHVSNINKINPTSNSNKLSNKPDEGPINTNRAECISNDKIENKKENLEENKDSLTLSDDSIADGQSKSTSEETETEKQGTNISNQSHFISEESRKDLEFGATQNETILHTPEQEKSTNKSNFPDTLDINTKDEITYPQNKNKNLILDESRDSTVKTNASNKRHIKKNRFVKKAKNKSLSSVKRGRMTRSQSAQLSVDNTNKEKGLAKELKRLQEDIKEMSIAKDILNATGIRTCRIAKLVGDNNLKKKETVATADAGPRVMLENVYDAMETRTNSEVNKIEKKKQIKKPKSRIFEHMTSKNKQNAPKYKPGPKSKKIVTQKLDPFDFDTDSLTEENSLKDNDQSLQNSSDSDNDSLASTLSQNSSELLIDIKKKKRKRGWHWKSGIIKRKSKKKKQEVRFDEQNKTHAISSNEPDVTCFTDKDYCFRKNVFVYPCRFCDYSGVDIVHHYKKHHPHSEIPLSRMSPEIAEAAIEQCEEINFTALSKLHSNKYICRFCFAEFSNRKSLFEVFFWHMVSTHTGEYKQICPECVNVNRCPFKLDIPPPPDDSKGQLIGYLCGKCNFAQISLENLKTHVIDRHDDEETVVYTINFAFMTKKALQNLSKCHTQANKNSDKPESLSRSLADSENQCDTERISEAGDFSSPDLKVTDKKIAKKIDHNIKSKIMFETDDIVSDASNVVNDEENEHEKVELKSNSNESHLSESGVGNSDTKKSGAKNQNKIRSSNVQNESQNELLTSTDINSHPHFKIINTITGGREYVCCVNRNEYHYRTSMTISMKKHVQGHHKDEKWDGYCFVCKLIVTAQGMHSFKDCLQHFLDKHMDDFPVLESTGVEEASDQRVVPSKEKVTPDRPTSPKTYIAVRPLSELMQPDAKPIDSNEVLPSLEDRPPLPRIASVISLGSHVDQPVVAVSHTSIPDIPNKDYKYEEWQAEIISKKHIVVLATMMNADKLVHVFKCAGRFCSYSSDSAESAILHASAHQRLGGDNTLVCAYCNFDASDNAIDLVMHVFKNHGMCQFSCEKCFYRAAASQLVGAHMKRAHIDVPMTKVLRSSSTPITSKNDTSDMLLREVAVPFIECNLAEDDGFCKFRTYTTNKFYEHLQQKHSNNTSYVCYQCLHESNTIAELVHHKRSHGLKLYQCTWCVHGVDTETELLSHSSAQHPNKSPQAYLRIITNKGRVLPLAQFNKSILPVQEIAPCLDVGDPVRDAERSIELEKLIGHTMPMTNQTTATVTEKAQNAISSPIVSDPSISNASEVPRLASPIQNTLPPANVTPIARQESSVLEPQSGVLPDVISLDSDEEDSKQDIAGMIDLALEKASSQHKINPAETLNSTTETLNKPTESLDNPTETLNKPTETLNNPTETLNIPTETLNIPTETLNNPTDTLNKPTESSKEIPTKQIEQQVTYRCYKCHLFFNESIDFKNHVLWCFTQFKNREHCPNCKMKVSDNTQLLMHINTCMSKKNTRSFRDRIAKKYTCSICSAMSESMADMKTHIKKQHSVSKITVTPNVDKNGDINYIVEGSSKVKNPAPKRKLSTGNLVKQKRYSPEDVDQLPINPILDESVFCAVCEFSTKVRINMLRHLQQHAQQQPVAQTAPVNPVPHLESHEKHFDKMINLASSSVATRGIEKTSKPDNPPTVTVQIAPELTSRYPKYVPERQRYTCGANGCSYISVDEAMLKYHWETLHNAASDFRCPHCPPNQSLDKSRPLSAIRVISHLKMHDVNLYGCSLCHFYHYKNMLIEKHLREIHENRGAMVTIREETSVPQQAAQLPASGPTMDLKPWQCGLCQFKHMLLPTVAEHCARQHHAKMQFKCSYCPFRTSTIENITKHQASSHAGRPPKIFYFYYKEGSLPDEDGRPLWQIQREKMPKAANLAQEIKSEDLGSGSTDCNVLPASAPAQMPVNLNVVKKESMEESSSNTNYLELLRGKMGQFCDPNGLKYVCPLCKVCEESMESMQSHLYEELRYRKWGCKVCLYRAFHKKGLDEHMTAEHSNSERAEPVELPVDRDIETWVLQLLQHQTSLMQKSRANLRIYSARDSLENQVTQVERTRSPIGQTAAKTDEELVQAFGSLGASRYSLFCCPKCDYTTKEETGFQNHLETELSKIRWGCSNCSSHFQTYHEAQFHCKTIHTAQYARPKEAVRDPSMRASWVAGVIRVQRSSLSQQSMLTKPVELKPMETDEPDNSLLVVRYAEQVETPEQRKSVVMRKKPIQHKTAAVNDDSEEDNLVIDESSDDTRIVETKKSAPQQCPYCDYQAKNIEHVLSHYGLNLYRCSYCVFGNRFNSRVSSHQDLFHPGLPKDIFKTSVPKYPPFAAADLTSRICLTCFEVIPMEMVDSHLHKKADFIKFTDGLPICSICNAIFKDLIHFQAHHKTHHPESLMFSTYHALFRCDSPNCNKRFRHINELHSHHRDLHKQCSLKYSITPPSLNINQSHVGTYPAGTKRPNDDTSMQPQPKRVAKKSTTKLPKMAVAKKSTTKLPFCVPTESLEEYSYYGTNPTPLEEYTNVTATMRFGDTTMPFTLKKLSEFINVNPSVVVKKHM